LKTYSFANATWPDLIALLDRRTPEDLAAWSHAWVEEPGRPEIRAELKLSSGKVERLALSQSDSTVAHRNLRWNQHISVAVGSVDGVKLVPVHLAGATVDVTAAHGLPASFVLANGGGIADGGGRPDPPSPVLLAGPLPGGGGRHTR